MGKRSKKVTEYIAGAAPFARPILREIRARFHAASPEIEETIKWGVPFFVHQGIVANMAAFKAHVAFGFWKSSLLKDPTGLLRGTGEHGMGGARFRSIGDLPPKGAMRVFIREAVRLNAEGIRPPTRKRRPAASASRSRTVERTRV